ncbi:MAG: glycosyltransferase [Actinomycetota bacterium]
MQLTNGFGGPDGPDAIVTLDHLGGVSAATAEGPVRVTVDAFPDGTPRTGAAGLAAVLEDLAPEDVVVLRHDDVEVADHSLALLAAAVRASSAALVVPFTNDLGTDHELTAAGGLPVGELRPVRVVRPSCVAGRARDLADLVPRRLHDPLSLLSDVDLGAAVVGGTSARHRNACVEAVRERGRGPVPAIVASMIVRDEEAMLDDCLASVRDVVDRIVVVDTGSVDGTVELARSHGAEVLHREWRDDFGWARNEALRAAPDAAWALWIDADERLVCHDPGLLRGYLRCFAHEHDILEVTIRNLRSDGSETTRFAAPRLLRAPVITFWGALHEHPTMIDPEAVAHRSPMGLCSLDHLGYADDLLVDRAKQDRNVAVAEAAYERDPRAKTALDLARSLSFAQRDPGRAVELYRIGLRGVPEHDHRARAFVHAQLAGHLQDRVGDEAAALAEAEAGLSLVPADPACRAVLARALFALGRADEIVEIAADLDARPSLEPMSSAVDAGAVWRLRLAHALAGRGRGPEAWELVTEAVGSSTPLGVREVTDLLEVAAARGLPALLTMLDAVTAVTHVESREAVLRTLAVNRPRAEVVDLCRALVERHRLPEAVVTGAVVAMLERRDADVAWFTGRADLLDADTAAALAARIRSRDHRALPLQEKSAHFA